jgi:hypothetical protein
VVHALVGNFLYRVYANDVFWIGRNMGISRYWPGLRIEYKSGGKLRTGIIEIVITVENDKWTYGIRADHSGYPVFRKENELWRAPDNQKQRTDNLE